ncbi:glycosyltransferase family 4 protein [Algoriphagus iocasae]|uniref:glycosyltransferase family 4 protein n=1 Tax=Algoriphagus iocasae TaxID=1836499 RepID=UPI001FE2D6A5|nr:glycosyltransferase [Algoriphagus iocasae]
MNPHFDFYFGNKIDGSIAKLDYSKLSNFRGELRNITLIFKPFYYQIGAFKLLFKKYDKFLLLGEYYCVSTWLILIFGKILNKKVFLWTHGWYGNESFIKGFVKKVFFKMADGLFLYGDYAKKLMISEGFDGSTLHVVYNSLDYDQQFAIRKRIQLSSVFKGHFLNNNPNLIFIGRLTKIKRLDLLIEAVSLCSLSGNAVNLTIIGDGDELSFLEVLVRNYNLNVWFYGPCYEEEKIAELVYNADLCVSPGNVGLTAMHSLGYGTPVITHNDFTNQMPEFEAIAPGETGDFFEYQDINSLHNKIITWLDDKSGKRELVRQNCFKMIDLKYNPKYQSELILSILEKW